MASSRHWVFLRAMGLAWLTACGSTGEDDATSAEDAIVPSSQDGPSSDLPEAVQIMMPNGIDYCTGVLVKPDIVVTAAHCLLRKWTTWTVRAPFAPNAEVRRATLHGVLTRDYMDPTRSDIGALRLDAPIVLPAYGELTEIGGAVDRGETFRAVAVGRERETPRAALVRSKPLAVRSGAPDGYPTGLATEYYSLGGDSGGGLFLLDAKGRVTHRVVGFERQPDPPRADYFTRVDAAVKRLVERGGVPSP
jgi:hypothetical protein